MNNKEEIGYSARESQEKRLKERRITTLLTTKVCDLDFKIEKGVYHTAEDTELMAKVIKINASETFLEIGCGCGAISIILSKRCERGDGVDINSLAIHNSELNAKAHNVQNVQFSLSDVFENIVGKYDVIIFNPPYSCQEARDEIDKMFWDERNKSKIKFFKDVKKYLKPRGRIYFGWADFDDLDKSLPLGLARENNLTLKKIHRQKVENKPYTYLVYEFL